MKTASWCVLCCLGACITTAFIAKAQDTRRVTKPVFPPACVTLIAEKTGEAEKLAEKFEKTADTARIQQALDRCKPGMAVELAAGKNANAFLSGALELREGVTLLIDKGVVLYGSRDPKDFDPNPADTTTKLLCGTMSNVSAAYITAQDAANGIAPSAQMPQGRPCNPLISVNVKNAAIMGEGVIDGRGGATVVGHDYSWWQMARAAEPKQLRYYSTRLIAASHADGFVIYGITLHNAANEHVAVNNTNGFTAWGVHLQTPTVRGVDARNTDGIDPGSSTNITITESWIDNGDDNIAVKTGVTRMSVLNNHFYNGHGMSIGSETYSGVSDLLVDGLTEDHTSSGIRIKSNAARGGLVHDLTYRNICMRNVSMPIAISPFYNNGIVEGFVDPGIQGDRIPDYKNIALQNIFTSTPGDVLIAGKDAAHVTEVRLDNVTIKDIKPEQVHSQFASAVELNVNFELKGPGVVVTQAPAVSSLANAGNNGVVALNPSGMLPQCAVQFKPMQ